MQRNSVSNCCGLCNGQTTGQEAKGRERDSWLSLPRQVRDKECKFLGLIGGTQNIVIRTNRKKVVIESRRPAQGQFNDLSSYTKIFSILSVTPMTLAKDSKSRMSRNEDIMVQTFDTNLFGISRIIGLRSFSKVSVAS